mmetsp:Transcript_5453/g.8072  ORF Transcript_5453/g.8072 Transcript_5453/m.8072 type:complete len:489 (+) Transcript_5453:104-1570(+)
MVKLATNECCLNFLHGFTLCRVSSRICSHHQNQLVGIVLYPKNPKHSIVLVECCQKSSGCGVTAADDTIRVQACIGHVSGHQACVRWYMTTYPHKEYVDFTGYSVKADGTLGFRSATLNVSPFSTAFPCEQELIFTARNNTLGSSYLLPTLPKLLFVKSSVPSSQTYQPTSTITTAFSPTPATFNPHITNNNQIFKAILIETFNFSFHSTITQISKEKFNWKGFEWNVLAGMDINQGLDLSIGSDDIRSHFFPSWAINIRYKFEVLHDNDSILLQSPERQGKMSEWHIPHSNRLCHGSWVKFNKNSITNLYTAKKRKLGSFTIRIRATFEELYSPAAVSVATNMNPCTPFAGRVLGRPKPSKPLKTSATTTPIPQQPNQSSLSKPSKSKQAPCSGSGGRRLGLACASNTVKKRKKDVDVHQSPTRRSMNSKKRKIETTPVADTSNPVKKRKATKDAHLENPTRWSRRMDSKRRKIKTSDHLKFLWGEF